MAYYERYGEGAEDERGGVREVMRDETGGDGMNFFYTRLFVLSAMLLAVLAGCQSYALPVGGHKFYYSRCKARSGLSSSRVWNWSLA